MDIRKAVSWSLLLLLLASCSGGTDVAEVLRRGGGPFEDAYWACLMNGVAQGIPLPQIQEDCALESTVAADAGLGRTRLPGTPDTGPVRTDPSDFDPATVSAACDAGDGRIGGGRRTENIPAVPVGYKGSDTSVGKDARHTNGMEAFGYGTYGGKGVRDEDGNKYIGLSEQESKEQKAANIREALEALDEYTRAKAERDNEKDPKKRAELDKKVADAKKKWDDAYEKAESDPNKYVPGVSEVTREPTPCEEALQAAREFLYECHRTGWESSQCQQLQARLQGCPAPTQIYVDPGIGGFSCAPTIDAEALRNAWVARCELLHRGVLGTNPCAQLKLDPDGRFAEAGSTGFCRPEVDTYVIPDGDGCITVVRVEQFGALNPQTLLVWAINKLGGPVVVLPVRDPVPAPQGPGPGGDPAR